MQAYCVKCKTKRDMVNPRAEYSATGRAFTRGTCPVCGTSMMLFGTTPAHDGLAKPEPQPAAAKAKRSAAPKKKAAAKSGSKTKRSATAAAKKSAAPTKKSTAKKSASSKSDSGPARRTTKLVIVESPAKARTVGNFLGAGYTVKASKGHVRDLLVSQLSVDVENSFTPKYRVPNDKKDTVKDLVSSVQRAKEIYLATDPDREGEAIAWHLLAATELEKNGPDVPVKRVVFHEITKPAIQEAFDHPRELDMDLVNAQQARRILDRLVGYTITELLWDKVQGGRYRLSAGRVQSIATRLIVDREREIEAFVPREYWTIEADLQKQAAKSAADGRSFAARLVSVDGNEAEFGDQASVLPVLAALEKSRYRVADIKRGERQRKPSAPFTTSTLQQEASRRLGFSASRTMAIAQQLYEGISLAGEGDVGLITYMRTDSLSVSPQAQKDTRDYVTARFGKTFLPDRAPVYKTKAKSAQEAHEAIRPTQVTRDPAAIKAALSSDQFKLYNLIWQRFVASQMSPAVYNTLRVDIGAGEKPGSEPFGLRVSGSTIKFQGFLILYEDSRDDDVALDEDDGRILPEMQLDELLKLLKLRPEQHFTQPPPRYTEASLVRTLEEYGIGRPSTYAPTVSVIQDRDYVTKQDKRLVPTETGRLVNDLLVQYFPDIMDYQFTARMEDNLDEVAEGDVDWVPMLGDFYRPFENSLKKARESIETIKQEEPVGRMCPSCGTGSLMYRYGKFGKFIACSNYPDCRYTEQIRERIGVSCPTCGVASGGEIIVKRTRTGREFYGCSRYPECDFTSWQKPLAMPCPHCGGAMVQVGKATAKCTVCSKTTKLAADASPSIETA
jgi:DNA topoisomerase I